MSMNAIAVLRVAPDLVRQALPALDSEDVRRGANGEPVRIRGLDNATLVHLDAPLTEDPEVLGALLAMRLGDVLAAHDEDRGVPIYPESYALKATTWDAALEELGDGADWVAPPAAGGMPDLGALLGGGGMDQLAGLAQQLQGPGGQDMLQQAMQMAQSLAQSGALEGLGQKMAGATTPQEAMAKLAGDAAAAADTSPGDTSPGDTSPGDTSPGDASPGGMNLGGMDLGNMDLGNMDLGAMMQQAQSMLAANPDLQRQLQEQLGDMLGGQVPGAPDAGDASDEDE